MTAAAVLCTFFPPSRAEGDAAEAAPLPLPILMYHSILPDERYAGRYVLPPSQLESDLRCLAAHGYETVTVRDLILYVDRGTPLPDKPVMLTFDDGFYNNCVYLPPLMEEYGMRAVVSPVGAFTDAESESEERSVYYSMASWDDLRDLSESGLFELQNHSYGMHAETPRFGAKRCAGESDERYQAALAADLSAMQDRMEANCGVRPEAFVYPFGGVDRASGPVLVTLGFRASLCCEERVNLITRDPACLWLLGRFNRPYGIRTEDFMEMCGII